MNPYRRDIKGAARTYLSTDNYLNVGFVGVKLDGDAEKALVKRFSVSGYPTLLVLDPTGMEASRFVGYRSSKELLEFLGPKR